ncbi:MAG: phosphodiester glycosidase family protein [Candidatus Daviesbacteria bacterium]|nr:phosphodiester glycosidase family protein [Candidatus Daviesbacteria bacterium]
MARYKSKTGIFVDIQNIGKNNRLLAVKEEESIEKIRQGIWLKKGSLDLNQGNFTNYYDLYYDQCQPDIAPNIFSTNNPFYLFNQVRSNPEIIGSINGAFYFLTDFAERYPLDLQYDLCIRDYKIKGLPSEDQPIAFIEEGKINFLNSKAQGLIKIGNKMLSWVGSKSKKSDGRNFDAILYNSKCSNIIRFREEENNIQIGVLDSENITTLKGTEIIDLVINADKNNDLKIADIKKGGGTHFFNGLFILQIKFNQFDFKINDSVNPLTLDNLKLENVSSAITIGRSVHDKFYLDPERKYIRDARSLVAEDKLGNIHFIVFDGSKYIPGFKGPTTQEVSSIIKKNGFRYAYFLDGGGSSRLIARDAKKIRSFANEFAFRKFKYGKFLWDWERARLIASSISLKINSRKQS